MEKFGRTYQPHVLADGAQMEFPFRGNFVRMVTSTGLLKLGLDDGPMVAFPSGGKWKPMGDFSKVRIQNDTGGSVSFTIALAYGEFDIDEVRLAGGVMLLGGVALAPTADVTLAPTAATLVKAANASRKEILITNLSTTVTLRVSGAAVGAAAGTPVGPGQTITLETQAAVHAYNPDAGAVDVAVNEGTV